ncbi:hypothetical protein Val02_18300 [Virgisporangium aliadipatigenens]|uniref:PASTA domain-containing protein n=1 Tax=Virgisporangium aliadipatigenens TaxID=741659 RepID=A0A8J3YGU3_9ACTN|nr:PASTA domain-containing protein [Virgisporangium aliadipatigenens]GIJ44944.1 hypothetical protein Val02_18300 [Virgisporangium aliadipatigenens]
MSGTGRAAGVVFTAFLVVAVLGAMFSSNASQPSNVALETDPSVTRGPGVEPEEPVGSERMPFLRDYRLKDAEEALTALGIGKIDTRDATGRKRTVINPDNWIVESHSPEGGFAVDGSTTVILRVRKPSDVYATPVVTKGVVPDVECLDLNVAQQTLGAAGFTRTTTADGLGKKRRPLLDSNWLVTVQSVPAGERPPADTSIRLTVVKFGEPTGTSGCPS